jgi:hypothetical protein
LIDEDGYFLYNEDFNMKEDSKKVHITEKLDFVAKDLMLQKKLIKSVCINYRQINTTLLYKLNLNEQIDNEDETCSKSGYMLQNVFGTNLFLGTVSKKCWAEAKGGKCDASSCGMTMNDHKTDQECECPCSIEAFDYDHCQAKFLHPSDEPHPCVPEVLHSILQFLQK